jgi:pimeloyl-ACP methyl ester carboxylesterase
MTSRTLALAAIVTLLLTSCSRSSTPTAQKSPSPTPAASSVAWSGCGSGFQCGTVQVPIDYAHPSAGTIGIAVIRKPATDPAGRIGSVLTNPGGPGASGIEFLRGEASIMTNLNRHFDLVGFDPRGIGQSAPVSCADGPQEDAFNALDSVLDDPQEKSAGIQADKDFAAGCAQRSGNVLPFVDTPSAARDMDMMRAAFGDAKLTYLGFSYGTYLGETYAHLFPTHVRALALDGVIDPTLSANDMLLAQVVGFEKNLQAFLADCQARKSAATPCKYAQSGDPATKLMALMARLDTTPIQVGDRMLTRGLAVIGVLTPLYDQSTWSYLDQGLTLADQGNGTLLLAFADLYLGRNANGTYSNQTDANNAVNCLDHPVPSDVAVYDQLGQGFAKASPLFGPATQYSNLICAYWPVKPTSHPGPLTADGAPTILLVGGTNDPATPYAWAQAVRQQMSNTVLLTRQGNGHVSYDKSTCAKNAEDDYLISLKIPSDGAVCT